MLVILLGWMTTWIQYAYRTLECEEFQSDVGAEECKEKVEETIKVLIDINGYASFSLAIIPFLPAALIRFFTSKYPSDYPFGEMRTKVRSSCKVLFIEN